MKTPCICAPAIKTIYLRYSIFYIVHGNRLQRLPPERSADSFDDESSRSKSINTSETLIEPLRDSERID